MNNTIEHFTAVDELMGCTLSVYFMIIYVDISFYLKSFCEKEFLKC